MDIERGVLHQPAPGDHFAGEVELEQLAGAHLRPQQAERREVEALGAAGDEHRQVIVDPLVEAEARRATVTGGEVDARLPLGVRPYALSRGIHRLAPAPRAAPKFASATTHRISYIIVAPTRAVLPV